MFKAANDALVRFNLNESNYRGQYCDSAAKVASNINGLQAKIREKKSRVLYMHYAAHSLNLFVQDAVAVIPAYRNALSQFGNLINFVRFSKMSSLVRKPATD